MRLFWAVVFFALIVALEMAALRGNLGGDVQRAACQWWHQHVIDTCDD